ncbi:MAG: hypothetical protein ACI9HK_004568, partial [Pirellulaceae bacterium]
RRASLHYATVLRVAPYRFAVAKPVGICLWRGI